MRQCLACFQLLCRLETTRNGNGRRAIVAVRQKQNHPFFFLADTTTQPKRAPHQHTHTTGDARRTRCFLCPGPCRRTGSGGGRARRAALSLTAAPSSESARLLLLLLLLLPLLLSLLLLPGERRFPSRTPPRAGDEEEKEEEDEVDNGKTFIAKHAYCP